MEIRERGGRWPWLLPKREVAVVVSGGSGARALDTPGGASRIATHESVQETDDVHCPSRTRLGRRVPPQAPDRYDISYWYHGVRHHVQTSLPPGSTIVVNADGERLI